MQFARSAKSGLPGAFAQERSSAVSHVATTFLASSILLFFAAGSSDSPGAPLTWAKDVAPILQQESYLLPDPLLIPAGTVLECVGHFDNSAANPANPDPEATVRRGDQTFEEMFVAYLDTVVPVE